MSESVSIYILKLVGGKYYVGKSVNPLKRYEEHLAGTASAWTAKYEPVSLERVIENANVFDEDRYVKEYMAKYGIQNVRGGSYVTEQIEPTLQAVLQKEIWAATDCCTSCGGKGHFAARCPLPRSQYKPQPRPLPRPQQQVTCFRCGRKGHYATTCYVSSRGGAGGWSDSDSDFYDSD